MSESESFMTQRNARSALRIRWPPLHPAQPIFAGTFPGIDGLQRSRSQTTPPGLQNSPVSATRVKTGLAGRSPSAFARVDGRNMYFSRTKARGFNHAPDAAPWHSRSKVRDTVGFYPHCVVAHRDESEPLQPLFALLA